MAPWRAKNKKFVIISNNCWGAEIYKRYKREYNTPFVGLYICGEDFLKLLKNFAYYMNCDLKFNHDYTDKKINYPVGFLDDIEVHFLHYQNAEEAYEKWSRRVERMKIETDLSRYFFKICDRDLKSLCVISEFHELPFQNKVSFSIYPCNSYRNIIIRESENGKQVPDGVSLFQLTHRYMDIDKWILKKKFKKFRTPRKY